MFWSKPEGPHQIIFFLVSSQTALHNFWSILQSKWGKTLYHSSPSTQPLKPLTMVWQDSEVWLKRLSSTKLETVIALSSAKERKKKPAVNIVSFIFGAPCSPIHKEPLSPSSSIRGSQPFDVLTFVQTYLPPQALGACPCCWFGSFSSLTLTSKQWKTPVSQHQTSSSFLWHF